MGFFKDLFGPRQPCDLCQLGKSEWPADRSGSADWKLKGGGLNTSLLVCLSCRRFVMESGLLQTNPLVALSQLVAQGRADRPPVHAYLQHESWKKLWMHMLDTGGVNPKDEFAALDHMRVIEAEFMRRAGVTNDRGATEPTLDPEEPGGLADDFPTEISIPGGPSELTIPAVSFAEASTADELQQLYLTACSGAANLLVSTIMEMGGGRIPIQQARVFALRSVDEAFQAGEAVTHDTRGLWMAGLQRILTRWIEWRDNGDPVSELMKEYGGEPE